MGVMCDACGYENRETARFCGACAAPLVRAVVCHGCGAPNPFGQKFCDGCGAEIQALPQIPLDQDRG